jgi:hypothetical protein
MHVPEHEIIPASHALVSAAAPSAGVGPPSDVVPLSADVPPPSAGVVELLPHARRPTAALVTHRAHRMSIAR